MAELALSLDEALMTGKRTTVQAIYEPAVAAKTQEEADEMFAKIMRYLKMAQIADHTEEELKEIALSNLGYYAGYYDHETRTRVRILYNARHPIFGDTEPTPEEAIQAGMDLAQERNNDG